MPRSLDEWLNYIGNLHPIAWDLTLDRVATVAARLKVLKPGKRVVLVAGTNGKGSCCEAIDYLARASGLSVGVTTSPHVRRYNERFRIDGEEVSDAKIVAALGTIERVRGEVSLSYFEFSCLAALILFTQANVDLAVLEIGLGGRLDAMNIVDPDIAVILPIALDHQNYLGDTREAIGREKAGILRQGVPLILGDYDPPKSVLALSRTLGARVFQIGKAFDYSEDQCFWTANNDRRTQTVGDYPNLPMPSLGCAIQTVALLTEPKAEAVARLSRLALEGRMTLVQHSGGPVYFDVAHNRHAVEHLLHSMIRRGHDRFRVVFGLYADKDCKGIYELLVDRVSFWHLSAVNEVRAMPPEQLFQGLPPAAQNNARTAPSVTEAIEHAVTTRSDGEPILVFGSFPVVAEALEWFDRSDSQ